MFLPKTNKFIKDVLTYVKFPFDRESIKKELEDHITEKIEYYCEQGYDLDKAEDIAIEDMGNSRDIGVELNKQHNPLIGWIWRVSSISVKLLSFVAAFILILHVMGGYIFVPNPMKDITKEGIVYKVDVNERVRIDDRVITVTHLIYDKNSTMHIIYNYYETKFWRMGWSLGSIGEISDNLGNTYHNFTGAGGSGFGMSKVRKSVRNFSSKADTLIIDYDRYDRHYRFEIPLPVGDEN